MTADSPVPQPEQVAAFFQKHRTGLVTLVFTDLADSTALLHQLGDQAGATFLRRRRQILREVLHALPEAEEIETAGDSFLLVFAKPSDAVRFALQSQARLRAFSLESGLKVQERMGIHLGEVVISEHETEVKAKDLYGIQLAACARVMSLAVGGQVLLTRGAFDSARQVLKGEDLPGVGGLRWVSHGPYLLKGIEEPVEVCEVAESGETELIAPKTSEKAQRQVRADEEPVLGWRPAVGQEVPNTRWVLEQKLGEGGFGEVWLGRHQTMKERRVFKFCFRADRVRSLKREMTLFRLIKERIGDHPHIVALRDVYFEQPPYFLEEDYVAGEDLASWCQSQGGAEQVPLAVKLEIIVQIGEALQAAHEAGVIHRDVKPANILISDLRFAICDLKKAHEAPPPSEQACSGGQVSEVAPQSQIENQKSRILAKLTDFGIGQVVSQEYLAGVTKAGFTETMLGSGSSQTGTQLYMAPELLARKPASARSDIYSLGVVLYQLLVSDFSRPVTTDWSKDITNSLLREDLQQCFAGKPEDRFVGAGQLAKHLRALPTRQAELERREAERVALERAAYRRGVARTAVAATLLVALLATLALFATTQAARARKTARELRRSGYVADMNLAHEALEEGDLQLGRSLVRKHRGDTDLCGFEWRYVWGLGQGDEAFTFNAHDLGVSCAVVSPDGKTLATAGFDKTVKIYDLGSQRLRATLEGFTDLIYRCAVAFSPDGKMLAVGDCQNIWLWEVARWQRPSQKLACGTFPYGWTSRILVAFAPDGQTLAARLGSDGVRFWDTTAWQIKTNLEGRLRADTGALAYSPDGSMLAVGHRGRIELWDPRAGLRQVGDPIPFEITACLEFSPEGKVLAVSSYQGEVMLWNVQAGRMIRRWNSNSRITLGMAFSPDGRTLVTGGSDQLIHFWDLATQKKQLTLKGHANEIFALTFSPDGRLLASACKDGTAKVWPVAPRTEENELSNSFRPERFSPDGRTLVTSSSDLEPNLLLWNVEHQSLVHTLKVPLSSGVYEVSPDAKSVAIATRDKTLEMWSLDTGQRAWTTPTDEAGPRSVAFSPDNRFLAMSGAGNGATKVWELASHREVVRLAGVLAPLAFSPDGTVLAGGTPDFAVKLYHLPKPDAYAKLVGHGWRLCQIALSPDGKRVCSGSWDNTARLWDTATGRELAVLRGHRSGLHWLAFSADGKTVATSSSDETVKLWSVPGGQQLMTLRGFNADLGRILFSPDDTILVAGRQNPSLRERNVRFWRAPSWAEIKAAEKTTPGKVE